MKNCAALFLTLIMSQALASNEELLIVEEIKKSIVKDFNLKDNYKIIESKEYEEQLVEVKEKGLTGKLRNEQDRLRLEAQKNLGLPTDRPLTGAERVELLKEINRQKIKQSKSEKKSSGDWISSKKSEQDNWVRKKKFENQKWIEKKKKILASWNKAQKVYKKKIPEYKKNLTPIPRPKKYEKKTIEKIVKTKVSVKALSDYHLVRSALSLPVRDQGRRPTCAAFAGVRAMEIKLWQKDVRDNLSEQYFYFASRPKCQRTPCQKGGSWPYNAYSNSKRASSFDIPKLSDCSYSKTPKSNNDTQIPLSNSCNKGFAKVERFIEVKSTQEILNSLNSNHPVVGGFKLSKNFYKNSGYVFKKGSNQRGLDSHASGHAILLVGYIKLPEKLHASEGQYCFLTANSWGLGWGKGGHACLSEAWFNSFRYDMPFLAVTSVKSRNG